MKIVKAGAEESIVHRAQKMHNEVKQFGRGSGHGPLFRVNPLTIRENNDKL